MQKKSRSKTALPKIKSQERIDTLLRKDRAMENYNEDNDGIKVKWNKTINCKSSKAFRYEASCSVYGRKIDDLQKRQGELMKQISRMQGNINKIREQKMSIRGKIRKNIPLDNQNESRTTKSLNQLDIQNQIILTQNKIQRLRKRVDKEKEKNIKISNQVDIARKQLNTSKNVIRNIQISLNKIAQSYNEQLSVCTSLDQQIRVLNAKLLEQRAISAEQKHTITKQYQEILKKLKEELHEDQHKQDKKSQKQFYMTQIERQKSLNKNYSTLQNKKTISAQTLRNKLQKYEQDLTDIKKWAHLNTPDEITHKFLQKHSQNFQQYEYVQNYFQNLDALRRQKRQLLNKKIIMTQELFSGPTDSINLLNQQIQQIQSEKQCYRQNVDKFEQTFKSIKQIIIKCAPKMGLKIQNQIDEQKVEGILMMIKDLKLKIDQKKEYSQIRNSSDKLLLQEELEGVKKGQCKEQSQRILQRNDFLCIRESIMKKKKKTIDKQK